MPIVPISRGAHSTPSQRLARQPPQSQYLLAAAAQMHSEGRYLDESASTTTPTNPAMSAVASIPPAARPTT